MPVLQRRRLPVVVLLLALPLPAEPPKEPNANVRFGLPAADPKDRDAYLIERPLA
jgi:hypothetical protein